jgi:RNA polymerase sigma-70 factor (ECF subfamily)
MTLRISHTPTRSREETFSALFGASFDRVYAFVLFRTANTHAAEDITAEVFARGWQKLRDPGDNDAAQAWLFTTARRLVVDSYRSRSTQPISQLAEVAHPQSPSPEIAALTNERLALLQRCLHDASERERDVIGLRFVARLRNRDIASLIGTSEGNVAKILHRTLHKLRDRLSAEGYRLEDGQEERS